MAKKGGTKRKIPVEKITKKESLATCFTKRRYGLLSKASQLCLLSGAQIAVLATPPSSESNVSFYSFGHSSVDAVVAAFLAGHRPIPQENKDMREDVGSCMARKDLGLGFWWEDERLERSENPEELKEAMESMSRLLKNVKELDAVNNNQGDHHHQHEDLKNNDIKKIDVVLQQEAVQTLNLESNSAICCIPDDDFCVPNNNTDNNALAAVNDQDVDIYQLIDFETTFESSVLDDWVSESTHETARNLLVNSESVDDVSMETISSPNLCSDSQAVEDGDLVFWNNGFDEDGLRFANLFALNELSNIAAL